MGISRTSSRQDTRPSLQFYPDDWLSDPGVRMSSLAARGLWIELLCMMWRSPVRGYLLISNSSGEYVPLDAARVARAVGEDGEQVQAAFDELEENGVFSRDGRGWIYCRRMVRDWEHAQERQARGKRAAAVRWGQEGAGRRNGGMARVASVLGGGDSAEATAAAIVDVTGQGAGYRAWWVEVARRMESTEGGGVLEEAVRYARDCGDAATRAAKDLGALEHPEKYIAGKCKQWLQRQGRSLPKAPV